MYSCTCTYIKPAELQFRETGVWMFKLATGNLILKRNTLLVSFTFN